MDCGRDMTVEEFSEEILVKVQDENDSEDQIWGIGDAVCEMRLFHLSLGVYFLPSH